MSLTLDMMSQNFVYLSLQTYDISLLGSDASLYSLHEWHALIVYSSVQQHAELLGNLNTVSTMFL